MEVISESWYYLERRSAGVKDRRRTFRSYKKCAPDDL